MDDAEWRLQHLTTTKEPLSTSQVALLFQGVASIQPADGMAQEFVVTVVKEDRECIAHCCHITLPEVYHRCNLTLFVENEIDATTPESHDFHRRDIERLVSRLQLLDGGLVVGPSNGSTSCSIREIGQRDTRDCSRTGSTTKTSSPRLTTFSEGQEAILAEVIESGEIRMRAITWNHQAQQPPPAAILREHLLPGHFHVFAVGSEECENSIAKSVAYTSKAHWEGLLREALGESYVMICGHTLQATHNIVFVHKALVSLISDVKSHAVATGLAMMGSKLGNKGGIGISFCIGSTSLLFVNAHLAHARNGFEKRNSEYVSITAQLARALVGCSEADSDGSAISALLSHFDSVVWAGDLNYRLETDRATADALLAENNLEAALQLDQLTKIISSPTAVAFRGLTEGHISFPPTYKFDHDSDIYDTSKKQRVPSWTDRVLYKPSSAVELETYEAARSIRTSDHRPVHASFRIKIALSGTQTCSSSAVGDKLTHLGQSTSQVCGIM
mmetsp:Transcript_16709/g.34053  ORF Transcript_16709/g.34053 Transcript_16709/m.34053 type:complete len:502 (+) Transcript_16709:178-1683(+)|eukprot:CAMPEP_0171704530 /NCGR_PEP_ID=MMETSP0991-20121206/12712_1 /TAXON_ID=483369 /ORGANISM="non described non described, Strain CCMP2098" /LENGTH=501 /DNA_ID=CAMNT_0012294013 /DNA_START=121 /DNA_END=1626 /DNA_ORIENTATION=+